MSVPFLDTLLGKLYARGKALAPRGGLNFGPGLLLEQSALGHDVTLDPALFDSVISVDPDSSLPGKPRGLTVGDDVLQLVGISLAPSELVRLEIQIVAREQTSGGAEMRITLGAVYRRIRTAAPALFGSLAVSDVRDAGAAGWTLPELQISDNSVILVVTGAVGKTIGWGVDFTFTRY